jgi:hypothetical protein
MEAHCFTPNPTQTYATRKNAIRAVEKVYGPNQPTFGAAKLHYLIMTNEEGRFFPVFVGERALQGMVHFHFCVIA